MIVAGAPHLLANGTAAAPYIISLYVLAIGAGKKTEELCANTTDLLIAMFKPNVSPTLLDQIKEKKPTVETLEDGEKVIIDPEATTERVVLWFYLL